MKMLWFLLGFVGSVLFAFSSTSTAAARGGGFRGSGIRGPFVVRNGGQGFRTGTGFRRGRRFLARQTVWPVYWYPFLYWSDYYPLDYSLLDNDAPDYSVVSVPSQNLASNASTNPSPVVVVINAGSTRSAEPSSGGYASNSSGPTTAGSEPGNSVGKVNEQQSAGPQTPKAVSPIGQQAAPATVQPSRPASQAPPGNSDRYVLVSWLNEGGKDTIYVQDTETNQVQKITSEPNRNNFRIVEVHPNSDPEQFEAIISNGSAQIPVRFRY
jgi:hypothetical protein